MAEAETKPRTRSVTIVDVARHSGVSKSTVSNVIVGSANVAEPTRERVLASIKELGYHPNALARDLKRRRAGTMGVAVGDLANPFYGELTKLIERHMAEANYATIICDTSGPEASEREKIAVLLEQRVAAIALTYFSGDEQVLAEIEASGVPVIGVSFLDPRFDCVACDDPHGARLAVKHLAKLGHRRIAYVHSDATEASTNAARVEGWAGALRSSRLRRGPLITLGAERTAGKVPLAEALACPERPTGFLAGNDVTALELIDQLEAAGTDVPSQASVIGFDDIAIARLGRLGLTTLHQPVAQIAELGIARLLERVGGSGDHVERTQQQLVPELIVRATTAPPPPERPRVAAGDHVRPGGRRDFASGP